MKKMSIPAVFLFVLGMAASAGAEMRYGPLALDSAAVLKKKTFEITGFYNSASPTLELIPAVKPSTPIDLPKVDLPLSSLNVSLAYGLSDVWEIGLSRSKISVDILDKNTVPVSSTNTIHLSGWSDTTIKAKVGNGQVAGTFFVVLPNGDADLTPKDNNMDMGARFHLSPKSRGPAKFHMNMGLTKWGKDDTPKKQSSTVDYGTALELHWTNGYYSSTGGSWTMEITGNTIKDAHGNSPLDFYSGLKIDTSKKFQLNFLLGLGMSDGSAFGKWELGWGAGVKWLFGA